MKNQINMNTVTQLLTAPNKEYMVWADGSEITAEELINHFHLEFVGEKINVEHNTDDFRIEDVALTTLSNNVMENGLKWNEWLQGCGDVSEHEGFPVTEAGKEVLPYVTGYKGVMIKVGETLTSWHSRAYKKYKKDND